LHMRTVKPREAAAHVLAAVRAWTTTPTTIRLNHGLAAKTGSICRRRVRRVRLATLTRTRRTIHHWIGFVFGLEDTRQSRMSSFAFLP
ncbi:MAG TPA: hypothetical protein VGN72_00020, partial [Tepidisphaeraceae bacterium]|nr:hypothetical protein [Tepidisphaeraceae bacterium]